MKIACLGNMNNIMFQIGRYLQDEGHNVTFFLFDEFDHFLPVADTYDAIENYKLVNLGWNFDTFFKTDASTIKKLFHSFDFLMGTDLSPAYLWKAGLKLDLYFPHGNDLYDYPFPKYKNFPPQLWEIIPYIIGGFQRNGIRDAECISLDLSEDVYEKPLQIIRGNNSKRVGSLPFLYLKQYEVKSGEAGKMQAYFSELRTKYKFVVFQHGSQDWSSRGPYKINKGNNILIEAFAKYLNEGTHKKDSALLLVEYGTDVGKSKELINHLGIESNVIWLAKMQRKDIMTAISNSDICVGELGPRHWFSYGCVFEFMAMKKPLIHHRNDKYYKEKGLELYPMIDADSVDMVSDTFMDYRRDPKKYIQMGKDAFDWLQKLTDERVKEILYLLNEKSKTKQGLNRIPNYFFHRFIFFLSLSQLKSYFFLIYHQLKNVIKGKSRFALN